MTRGSMADMPIRVVYDVSDLARFQATGYASGGTPRVVETLAEKLVGDPRCEVTLAALSGTAPAAAYCRRKPAFRTTRLGVGAWQRFGGFLIDRLRGGAGPTPGALRRASSKIAGAVRRWWQRGDGIPPAVLARTQILHLPSLAAPPERRDRFPYQRFVTIYDLIPKLHPELVDRSQRERMTVTLSRLRDDDWITCISEAVKEDVCTHTRIRPERVFVTPLGASPETFHARASEADIAAAKLRYGMGGDYLLTMSSLSEHKNLPFVLRCFGALIRTRQELRWSLALGGLQKSEAGAVEPIFAAYPELRSRVVFVGTVREGDLAALYKGAAAFLFPSLAEGFGLPVLEAMQCGAPVIASAIPAVREVAGDAAILVDPHDQEGWQEAMRRLHANPELQNDMRFRSVARSKLFSWEKCAEATVSAYESALRTHRGTAPGA